MTRHLNYISNGMDREIIRLPIMKPDPVGSTQTCEPVYGFLPCATTLWGHLFLLVMYEYLLSLSMKYISEGSDLFFQMYGTDVFSASLFQVIGILPQLILLLLAGVTLDAKTVGSIASIGMSSLAGTTIMLLTIIWGSVVFYGCYNLSDSSPSSNSVQKWRFILTGYGVRTDRGTNHTAAILLVSTIPFLILQLAKVTNSSATTRVVVLISLIATLAFLFAYWIYQIFQPWIIDRRVNYVLGKYLRNNLLQTLLTVDGQPDSSKIEDLFHKIDANKDELISEDELRALILGMGIVEVGLNEDYFVERVMKKCDISNDCLLDKKEFVDGLSEWLCKENNYAENQNHKSKGSSNNHECQSLLDSRREHSTDSNASKPWWNYINAGLLVILGTAIAAALGLPLFIVLQDFSAAANIPSFFVSYVVIPLAMGYRQGLQVITCAKQKTDKAASLTFSEIYNATFMNNMLGLVIFLLLVYIRDLPWDVSAEVLVVLFMCTAFGLFASFSTKIPFWTSIIAYLMYPICLYLLYFLTQVLGWS